MKSEDIAAVVARLLADYEELDEEALAEEEADTLEELEDARTMGETRGALAMVQAFAMAVPVHRGIHRVLAGDDGGWQEIERAWLLETFALRLVGPQLGAAAADLLAVAIALGEDEPARWLAEALDRRMAAIPEAYEGRFFAPFVARLHALAEGGSPQAHASADLGPYRAVLDAWGEPARLAIALADACDERVGAAAALAEEDGTAEFRFAPIVPFEIAAVGSVRRRRGEPMPACEHPLLSTPLAAIPTRRTYVPDADPWYARAREVAVAGGLLAPGFHWPG